METDIPEIADLPPSEDELLALKQRELILLRQRYALMREDGLAFYRPSEKQHEFHSSPAKERGLFAGNRFGKSEASAAETVAWFVGERTWYKHVFPIYGIRIAPDGSRVRTFITMHEGHENHPLVRQGIPSHSTKQLIITTDWKKVSEVWTGLAGDNPGKLWKYIPKRIKVDTKSDAGIINQVVGSNGSVIRFTTEQAYLKNKQSAESTDYDRVAIDEPIVQDFFNAVARGLVDRDGQADFTLTSLRERWIYDRFHPEPDEHGIVNLPAYRFSVRATMRDNPFLSDQAMARYLENLTDEEKSCRVEGLPLELSGLVYKEFHREVHVLKELPAGWLSWTCPPLSWTIYVAIDVHDQTPQAVLFVAVPPKGVPVIYDEIWKACVADDLCEEINLRLAARTVGFIKADPKAWEEDPVFRVSMAQRFHANGIMAEKASKAKSFGILNMRSILKRRIIDPASGAERPAVYFTPAVRRTLWEISRYHYTDDNKPVDADDHFMENMYRIFINEAQLVNISPSSNRPIDDFAIPMTRSAIRDFDVDARKLEASVGFRN